MAQVKKKLDTKETKPRIGVYVCHCGKNIAGVVNIGSVVEWAKTLPGVVDVKDNMYSCSDPGQEAIKKAIVENNLNRVVVAACSPALHEPTFRRCVERAGLNKYFFEMANIREHCSWVHMREPEAATKKAQDLVAMAVAKASLLQPIVDRTVPVTKRALVIGGGVAGCQAALDLGDTGFDVVLAEKSHSIGGRMAQLDKTFPTMDCSICILGPKLADVGAHPKIRLLSGTEIKQVDGYVGNFKVKAVMKPKLVDPEKCNGCGECVDVCPVILPREFDANLKPRRAIYIPFAQSIPSTYVIDEEHCIKCYQCANKCDRGAINLEQKEKTINLKVGTIVVATGCQVFDATKKKEYGYGRYPNVVTSLEFERIVCASGPTDGVLLRPDKKHAESFAFIQCVGSRDKKWHEYCSATCCMNSIKLALLIKEHDPDAEVFIFATDVRASGKGFEELYSRAREMGVIFVSARPSEIKEGKDGNPIIISENPLNGQVMETEVDMAILAVGIEPVGSAEEIARVLHIPRDSDGFYLEAHPKLKPVDSPCSGIFLAGAGKGPKDIKESVTSASAAAARAGILMSKGNVIIEGIVPVVNAELCTGCGLCTKVCPYGALSVKVPGKSHAELTVAKCHGCGTCVAECPAGALDQSHFTDQQILAQIDAALARDPQNKIITFCCNWCSYAGSDLAGVSRFQYPTNVRIIKVMCSGRVKEKFVLRAFEKGAGIVWVSGCHLPNDCHYISGNVWCKKRIERLQKALPQKIGIPSERLKLNWISAAEGIVFANLAKKYTDELKKFAGG